jgi:glucose/mannose-6-phosphate isomerase
MKFKKYYNDVKNFSKYFVQGLEIAKKVNVPNHCTNSNFGRVVLCGMGGSSLSGELVNNILSSKNSINIDVVRSYDIPTNADKDTFFIVCSYSGNTEETLSCYEKIREKGYFAIVFTAGGKLLEIARRDNVPIFEIPSNIQPRLSIGYVTIGILYLLHKVGLIEDIIGEVIQSAQNSTLLVKEEECQSLAKKLKNKVPIIYATSENFSIARIGKVKINENAKVQSFWNFFPELNHNEMIGFTKLIIDPFFIIFESKFTHIRNKKRIEVFVKMMSDKNIKYARIKFNANNFIEETLAACYFMDLTSYYLACQYDIDPEPVTMVEEFKRQI